jgi:hypothetical protein
LPCGEVKVLLLHCDPLGHEVNAQCQTRVVTISGHNFSCPANPSD